MSKTCVALCGLVAFVLATPTLAATTHEVTVGPGGAFVFSPAANVIAVGDTVRWTWDSGGHNVGAGLPGAAANSVFFSGPPAPAGTVFQVVFDQTFLDANPMPNNAYDYHCHPHGTIGMVGLITVAETVPAVSQWGLAVLAMALLTGLTVKFGSRRPVRV